MNFKPSASQVDRLLDELCVELGFCVSPQARSRLLRAPEPDIAAMTKALFRARRTNPASTDGRRLYREVLSTVINHYRAAEDGHLTQIPLVGQAGQPVRRQTARH